MSNKSQNKYLLPSYFQSHHSITDNLKPVRITITGVAWSKQGVGLDHLNTGIVGSNPAQGKNIYPRLFAFCCPVEVEVLRRATPPSKESYQMSRLIHKQLLIGTGHKA
jgi:hypothetical protein